MAQHAATINPWSPEARQHPHETYKIMRETQPVFRSVGPVSGNSFWFLTRYDDCQAALKDARLTKEASKVLGDEQMAALSVPGLDALNKHMLNFDPPDHTRLRGLVHKAFTPRMIDNLRPRIEEISATLLKDMKEHSGETLDLIDAFAFPVPIIVITELLGIPPEERAQFRAWTRAILFGSDYNDMMVAGMSIIQYLNEVFELREANPQDDLISGLLHVEENGSKLDRQELISMIFLLLVAGHETTVNLIASGTMTLLKFPEQKDKLAKNPGLIRTAVEEMLRYESPVENTLSRWAMEDIEIGGVTIPRGDIVLATVLGANRDPSVFPNPDAFDITRDPNKHIAFGNGIHYCLGAPLARMEGAIAINAMLAALPNLEMAVPFEDLRWGEQTILHGLTKLPVKC
jgi:cytochrome P450 PksS